MAAMASVYLIGESRRRERAAGMPAHRSAHATVQWCSTGSSRHDNQDGMGSGGRRSFRLLGQSGHLVKALPRARTQHRGLDYTANYHECKVGIRYMGSRQSHIVPSSLS